MVDRIRMFTDEFKGVLNTEKLNKFRPSYGEAGYKYYKLYSDKNKKEGIYGVVKTNEKGGERSVVIDINLRKWKSGMNAFPDLYKKDFVDVIEGIGEKLCKDKNALWGFKVSAIEIGFNVQLPLTYKGIVDSYGSYKTFRRIWYEGETMCFEGKDSYSMIIYDKGEEIVKKLNSKKSKKKPLPMEKLNSRGFWLRYELKTNKLSKVSELSDIANEPGKINKNWNAILDILHAKIKKLKYVENTVPSHLINFEGKNLTDLKNYFIAVGVISYNCTAKAMALGDKLERNKDTAKSTIREIMYNQLIPDVIEKEKEVKRRIAERVKSLRTKEKN